MKNWIGYVIVGVGVAAYNIATEADRDDSGAIVDAGNIGAFQLRSGDCFNDAGYSFEGEEQISSLPGVPCTQPHDNEVYAVFDVSLSSYPSSEDAMFEHALEKCLDRFPGFVGRDYETSELDILTLYPTQTSWRQNDREVVCAVYDINSTQLVGSARNSGR